MVLLSKLTVVRLSGADAGDFLHNQLSADVLALAHGESVFACYCEPKGRVLALMLVARNEQDYLIIMSGSLAVTIATRLKMYVMRSKVSIEVLDNVSIAGAHSEDEAQTLNAQLAVIEIPGGNNSFLLSEDTDAMTTSADEVNAWKLSELRKGICWLCPETSGQFLPQMLGFDQLGAVNFRKGCYPGQEIVARTHYLGKVKRHPRLVCTQAAIHTKLMDKLEIRSGDQAHAGVITDYGHHQDGGTCIFVVTRMDPALVGEMIEYQGQEAKLVNS